MATQKSNKSSLSESDLNALIEFFKALDAIDYVACGVAHLTCSAQLTAAATITKEVSHDDH